IILFDKKVFNRKASGGKLGALPINAKGRKLRKDMSIVCAHADQVDDFCFMTFNDDLLVTCSRDDNILLENETAVLCLLTVAIVAAHIVYLNRAGRFCGQGPIIGLERRRETTGSECR
ncbi:hypothetical protein GCK32_020566, partial [Trichostrongylus colubriformis]